MAFTLSVVLYGRVGIVNKIINIASFSRSRLNQDPKAGSFYGWHSQYARKIRGVVDAAVESWSIDAALRKPEGYDKDGMTYRLFPSRWFLAPGRELSPSLIAALRDEARSNNVVVHLHDYHNWQSYMIALRFKNLPVVAHYHGATRRPVENLHIARRLPYAPLFLLEEAFERAAVRNIRHFFIPNTRSEAFYARLGKPYSFCPMAPELGQFHRIDRDVARREIGISGTDKVILNVGGFSPVKNLELLLRAFVLVQKEMHAALYLVGPTYRLSYRAAIQRLIIRYGLTERVAIVGMVPRERLNAYYNAADALAVSSTADEGGPTVILEALSVGTPIVSTPIGFTGDLSDRAVGMITVSGADPAMFAESLVKTIRSAKRRAMTPWTWDDVRKAVEPVYRSFFGKQQIA